ncbi:hypothetical protein Tco_0653087 [Tanacetum coccineum]|uniref:Uncharacterized protein n=1 Tax=Tanacetum coccineum TaxID=301880 RepID=A0ABQ4WZE3_9ASTR
MITICCIVYVMLAKASSTDFNLSLTASSLLPLAVLLGAILQIFDSPVFWTKAVLLRSWSILRSKCFIGWVDPSMCHIALDVILGMLRARNELKEVLAEQCTCEEGKAFDKMVMIGSKD